MTIRVLFISTLCVLLSPKCLAGTSLKIEPAILKNVEILAKAKELVYKKYPSMESEEYYAFLRVEEDGYGVTFSTLDITKLYGLGNNSKKRMVYVLLDKDGMKLKEMHLVK